MKKIPWMPLRVLSVFVYLNTVPSGGATSFPYLDPKNGVPSSHDRRRSDYSAHDTSKKDSGEDYLKIKAEAGKAAVWSNVQTIDSTQPERAAFHQGEEVLKAEGSPVEGSPGHDQGADDVKWMLGMWIRDSPVRGVGQSELWGRGTADMICSILRVVMHGVNQVEAFFGMHGWTERYAERVVEKERAWLAEIQELALELMDIPSTSRDVGEREEGGNKEETGGFRGDEDENPNHDAGCTIDQGVLVEKVVDSHTESGFVQSVEDNLIKSEL